MMQILPTVLVESKEACEKRILDPSVRALAPLWQYDVLDGSLFSQTSFADPEFLATLPSLPQLELHLMISNPIPVIENWHALLPNVKAVIVHTKITGDLQTTLETIKMLGLRSALAIEAQTDIEFLSSLQKHLDFLLLMGVRPGTSGQPFLGDIVFHQIEKIKKTTPDIPLAVDGGITLEIAPKLAEMGVSKLCIASSLWNAKNPGKALEKFINI